MPPFRFQGRSAFVTYSGIGHEDREAYTHQELYDFLNAKFPEADQVIVGWELHQDGTPHAHCFIKFNRKVDIRATDWLDFKGHHPNIQTARNAKQVIQYCTKDNEVLSKFPIDQDVVPDHVTILQGLEQGLTPEEAAVACVAKNGGKSIRYFTQLVAFGRAARQDNRVNEPFRNYPTEFPGVNEHIKRVLDIFVDLLPARDIRNRDGRSMWFYGPSRVGKTQLARSLGRHWYMQGMWNLDQYTDDADYGVIDDFDWEQFARWGYKPMLGLQYQCTVTDKYRGKKTIQHGKPVIMITNELPLFRPEDGAWLEANVDFIYFNMKLYQ